MPACRCGPGARATARRLSRLLALSGEAVTCLLTGQPRIAATSGRGPIRQGPRSGKPMRYDEIRQHVQEHFRDAPDRLKGGIVEAGAVAGSVLASHAADHLQGQGPDSDPAVAPASLAAYRFGAVQFAGMVCVAHIRSEGVDRDNGKGRFRRQHPRPPLRISDEKRKHRHWRVSSVPRPERRCPPPSPEAHKDCAGTDGRSPRRDHGAHRVSGCGTPLSAGCISGPACRSPIPSLDSDNAIAYPKPATVPRKRMKRERRTGKSQAATALATVGGESCAESTGPTGREGAAGRLSRKSGDLPWHNATAGEVPGRSCATAHSARRGGSGRGPLPHLSGP